MSDRIIWQIAAGDTNRDYSDLCLKWGVVLNGPGDLGPWPNCKDALLSQGVSKRKIADIHRFADEIKDGDVVLLRMGTTVIRGVGVIRGSYEYSDTFGDIDGWDLQHIRRVQWIWKSDGNTKKFPKYTLKYGDTTQRIDSKQIDQWLSTIDFSVLPKLKLPDLPQSDNQPVDLNSIAEYLFDHGVASSSIENLVREIGELTRIAAWYRKSGNPSEEETRAYLVAPLLRALGWTPQKMAVEWKNVDIALFKQLPRADNNLVAVAECKKMNLSCLTAKSQAESYSAGKPSCQRLIVTDGIRYGVFLRQKKEYKLFAYMNLTRLRASYPVYDCKGVKSALRAMTPEWTEYEANED
jgi:hypothetical protein